ncbi:hypothetical protein [Marinomonas fungiae]|uniref:Sugar ABC transporter n=1 Tax=Marinomonas fungiae TaxID=1137284 RepID=A0A0K6ISF8_9GAMM|nr:hypothetical protein [Marinomonas fungiae]CUB06040.1 hypothetical protein Ga0061065_11466 [Marinomonas fungiae]
MIYTVECSFNNPAQEAEWNAFYSNDKLPALISVNGFITSQRFIALTDGCPRYLAIHSIRAVEVLSSRHYLQAGGGNFAKWQEHITDWHRNIYDMPDQAPEVKKGDYLLCCEASSQALLELGLKPIALNAIALDKQPEKRWLAVSSQLTLDDIKTNQANIHVYQAMGKQLTSF